MKVFNLAWCFAALLPLTGLAVGAIPQGTPPGGVLQNQLPGALMKPIFPGGAAKAVYEPLDRSWYDWDTVKKTVTIKRRTRPNFTSSWAQTEQVVSSSFWIVDVRWVCSTSDQIETLYILGIDDVGDSVVEKWSFTYTGAPLPRVSRSQLYRGSGCGTLRCLEPDPQERFVLMLNLKSSPSDVTTLYRLDLSTNTISVEIDSASFAPLDGMKSMIVRQHVSEGRQYHIRQFNRWLAGGDGDDDILVIRDPENDGLWETPSIVNSTLYTQLGYENYQSWESPCTPIY